MKNLSRRRGFLGKLIKSILALSISMPALRANSSKNDNKVKLLTPDGKLIELDQKVLDKKGVRFKTTNQDIIDWSEQIKC